MLVFYQGRFDDSCTHIEHSKSHVDNNAHSLGCIMHLQAEILYGQDRFDEAKSKVLHHTVETFVKLGAAQDLERCRKLLQHIEEKMNTAVATHEPGSDGEFLSTVLFPTYAY